MRLLNSSYRSAVSAARILACAGVFLGATAFSNAAGTVSVYLTGQKFGPGKTISVTSGNKTINAATSYQYKLDGVVRGTPGTPLAKVVKIGTPLKDFVEYVSPGGSSFLQGTVNNPGGALPVTLIEKTYAGTKNIKNIGKVKISFKVVGAIGEDGVCTLDITDVKFKTKPAIKIGSITFSKGSGLTITAAP